MRGEMVLIAARPSMGKTTLGMNIAANAAIRGGKKVAVFSLEMPVEQLMLRLMCSEAQVNMQNLRHGTLSDDELERLGDTLLPLSNAELYIGRHQRITVTEMRSRCRRLQIEHGLDLVMIDYIGLMSAGSGSPNPLASGGSGRDIALYKGAGAGVGRADNHAQPALARAAGDVRTTARC